IRAHTAQKPGVAAANTLNRRNVTGVPRANHKAAMLRDEIQNGGGNSYEQNRSKLMFGRKAALSALFVSTALAMGLTAGVSRADEITNSEAQFCRAIGLDEAQRPACMDQMAAASTQDERDTVAAAWIMRSPLAANSPNSLYQPPTDQNNLN